MFFIRCWHSLKKSPILTRYGSENVPLYGIIATWTGSWNQNYLLFISNKLTLSPYFTNWHSWQITFCWKSGTHLIKKKIISVFSSDYGLLLIWTLLCHLLQVLGAWLGPRSADRRPGSLQTCRPRWEIVGYREGFAAVSVTWPPLVQVYNLYI